MLKHQKNRPPLVSVVIPCFNSEKYIAQTIESVIAQNYSPIEVIIQDGGSKDGTVDIIKDYACKHSFIKWESQKDKGQCDAINKGMEMANGDILTYINSDDLYENEAFEKVVRVYSQKPDLLWVAGQGRVIDEKQKEIVGLVTRLKNILLKINKYELLLVVNYLMQPAVFLTKEAYRKYGPFDGDSFVMEYDLWLRLGKVRMPHVLSAKLASFRLSAGNITSTRTAKLLKFDFEIVRKHTKNNLLLFFHYLGNMGRLVVLKFVNRSQC
jgi:GT2 family glycosyltransferase